MSVDPTLPTFIVIGAMKAGTSSLATYLRSHPQVFMTTPKEPGFFSFRWDLGIPWYRELFAGAGDAAARGEASTNYTKAPHVPHVPERMVSIVPDVRLVYLVREPVARIRSQYVHNVANRGERRPLAVAVRDNPEYVDFSRHAYQLAPFLDRFGADQVLVVSSERLLEDREVTYAEICRFIGVDDSVGTRGLETEFNRGVDKRQLSPGVERFRLALNRLGVVQRFPEPVRAAAYRLAQRRPIPAEVDGETAEWIWDQIAADLQDLRAIAGPIFPLWGRA